jgi:aldehyde:ferredoxin oxidoreductase
MSMNRKVAIINLTTGEIQKKAISTEIRKKYLGGRGLNAYLLYNYLKPGVDPLGPDNVLVVGVGFLCATMASGNSRTDVMGKSPLTNLMGSTNMGGFFAAELALAGYHHLVFLGKAEKPVFLWVNNGEIEIRDASSVWGQTVTDTQWIIRKEMGDEDIKFCVCGPAGENLVRYANVMTGIKNSAGRTGMGAVMGSKNLKCVAARGTLDIKIAHPEQALEYNKRFIDLITSAKVNQTMGTLGTPFIWGATNSWGGVRTNNFQYNQLRYADEVEPESLDEISKETCGEYNMTACFNCQVHCRAKYKIPASPLAEKFGLVGKYDEGPEYTSQGAFNSEPGCTDAATLLCANHLVDQYGVDNLEIGSMIGWAMELYDNGILTDKDTDGVDLRFGNGEAVLEMIHRICQRKTWLGEALAEGPIRAAQKIGRDSEKYLVHVKGMSNLHSDERATPGLALNIMVSSRGSDHLRSRPAIDLYHLPPDVLKRIYSSPVAFEGSLSSDHRSYEGKPWQVFWQENCFMGVDQLGICKYHTTFLGATLPNFEDWARVIHYNTGLEITPTQIWEAAARCNMIERLINIREGFKKDDPHKGDVLVDRYYDEPAKRGAPDVVGSTLDREKMKAARAEFYKHKGLDENGIPTPETLKRLGLEKEPSHAL